MTDDNAARGPRFSGAQVLGGLGLLGVLITIAIMGLLAVRVLDTVSPSVSSVISTESTQDVASKAACRVNARALQTMADAYRAATGAFPADQKAIVEYGLIDEPIPNMELTVEGQSVVVTPVGPCA